MKRTKLKNRSLPHYTKGEEIMNMVVHIVGGGLGIIALLLSLLRTVPAGDPYTIGSCILYGLCMTLLYTISSVYHGLRPSTGKKVLQVLDHCSIYFLIAGTYTPLALIALRPVYPAIGWGLFFFEWTLTALAVTLTAVDLKKYTVFSMICYIGMGWAALPFMEPLTHVLTPPGAALLLWGGITYTVGAVLYGIGSKKAWFHCIFHIFVVLGSLLQFISIYFYIL